MIRSSLRRWTTDRTLLRDAIAILLAFAVGVGGLLFVFSLPDPFTPLLTPRDWPGSYASIALALSGEWSWRKKRGFHSDLELPAETYTAGLGQIAVWYADPAEAAAEWDDLDRVSYKEEPLLTSGGGDGEPESMLFCGSESMDLYRKAFGSVISLPTGITGSSRSTTGVPCLKTFTS